MTRAMQDEVWGPLPESSCTQTTSSAWNEAITTVTASSGSRLSTKWGTLETPIREVQLVFNLGANENAPLAELNKLLGRMFHKGDVLEFAAAVLMLPGAIVSHLGRILTVEASQGGAVRFLQGVDADSAISPVESRIEEDGLPDHSRMAKEIRDLSGLSATVIAKALGVRREQFQRWLSGSAISNVRYGQLVYLYTIIADLDRRLGRVAAQRWLHVRTREDLTPADLLERRRIDEVHRLVSSLPDTAPVQDGKLVALPVQESVDEYLDDEEMQDSAPWSPYDDPETGQE